MLIAEDMQRSRSPKKTERSASMRMIKQAPLPPTVPVAQEVVNVNVNESHSLFVKQSSHYECVPVDPSSVAVKTGADEDGYIVPMRVKDKKFAASSIHRHSMSSFNPKGGRRAPPIPVPVPFPVPQPNEEHSNYQQQHPAAYAAPLNLTGRRKDSRPESQHFQLEDHYGTVTGANFQALAQLLEQVR